jgi:N-dimethylarginine dimethylaminohydrolase
MVAPLETVIVRRPDESFGRADPVRWHYTAPIELQKAQSEHDDFVRLLTEAGVEVAYHTGPLPDHADAIYVHDPVIVTDRGAIVLKMGKPLRIGEGDSLAGTLESMGVPVLARLEGEALAEGGDLLWVDPSTLAVGQGYRTNAEGLRQMQDALPDVELIPVHLPHAGGPEACLHLMSFISIVAEKLAVAYLPLMPVPFVQFLVRRGFEFVEVPDSEFATMGPNVLALAPRECVMLAGNPVTVSRLEAVGCSVRTYVGEEISLKAEGGPTCLTRPVLRVNMRN